MHQPPLGLAKYTAVPLEGGREGREAERARRRSQRLDRLHRLLRRRREHLDGALERQLAQLAPLAHL